ncbi:hypothetical protein FD44_GL000103 [Secundilactobacillus malefermentans DSM 5705 = KCTC 3548]|nr:hypothetical protein FD44_GL000103 [Secundilactobacillus malefermentans DSM 5705 = KCTC 3548]
MKTTWKNVPIGANKKLIFVQAQITATTIRISNDQNIMGEFFILEYNVIPLS